VTEQMSCAHCRVVFEFTPRLGGRKRRFCTNSCQRTARRAANIESVREYDRAWKAANYDSETQRERYAANPEKAREASREWRAANPEKVSEYNRERRAADTEGAREYNRAWRAANPDKARESDRTWKAANPDKCAAMHSKRRALKRNALVPLTPEEKARVDAIYAEAQRLGYHVDHIKSLAKGGLHHPDNLVAIPPVMNMQKGTQHWPDLHALQ
jgi:hypothetical protein